MTGIVKYDRLPPGVVPLKPYRSLGCTLVECAHAETKPMMRTFVHGGTWKPQVVLLSEEVAEKLTDHELIREVPSVLPHICKVCHSTDLSRPVKMLAVVPKTEMQASLF